MAKAPDDRHELTPLAATSLSKSLDVLRELTHWWNVLHPERAPETVGVDIFPEHGAVIPVKTIDALPSWESLRGYLLAECGVNGEQFDRMTPADIVLVLKRRAEQCAALPDCYVTLQQMAAIVQKDKRTLERAKEQGKLGAPAVKGSEGKADEWRWSEVRPILCEQFRRTLPEVFPADRFARR